MRRRVLLTLAGFVLVGGLATGGVSPAQAADPYRIGMGAAITGRFSGGYAPTYEAYKAYFKRINDAGRDQRPSRRDRPMRMTGASRSAPRRRPRSSRNRPSS